MRVSRENLISLAKKEAEKRAAEDGILSAYLIGSVATGEPVFGGSADVDLVLIHREHVPMAREFMPLSKDFHFDILHHPDELYANPTALRIDPWLGPAMSAPIFLFDPEHFFERAQAGVRGQYHRVDYVHARALGFLSRARQFILNSSPAENWVARVTQSLLEGANAAATLGGFPAAGRRLVPILQARLFDLGQENLYSAFQRLLGANQIEPFHLASWIAAWSKAVESASPSHDRFSNFRQNYHADGFEILLTSSDPNAILWNLISEWNAACLALPHEGEHHDAWHAALQVLRLDEEDQEQRFDDLEIFLDQVEVFIERWAKKNGA